MTRTACQLACLGAVLGLGLLGCGASDDVAPAADTNTAGGSDVAEPAADSAEPLELSADLCEDASKMEALMGSFVGSDSDPSYGQVNAEQVMRMLEAPTEGPFYMVNLIRYRDQAVYPDGRETTLTGREANALYAPVEFITAIGAKIVYVGEAERGPDDLWDDVAIVEYPCPLAFFAMASDPEFKARSVHKDAGVETTTVMVTHLDPLEETEPGEVPLPATADDPARDRVRIHRYREDAQYAEGSTEPSRTGEAAKDRYVAGVAEAERAQGITPILRLSVEGVFIGDGRTWDEVWVDAVPSQAALDAATSDPAVAAAQHHLDAALEERYEVFTAPLISDLPGSASGQGMLPVTADGTGTMCEADDECPGGGVDTCFMATDTIGFCSRQGCGAGECQAPYVCCHDCNEAIAAMLPFEGSICVPADGASQLTAAPPLCTCD